MAREAAWGASLLAGLWAQEKPSPQALLGWGLWVLPLSPQAKAPAGRWPEAAG